jgi:enoyl-[acyl-carrier protein] reductase II
VTIPVIAAGGIASGRAMLAAEALGAEGIQVGSRFAASQESSAHENFKNRITHLKEGETMLSLKQLTPVRLIKNKFYEQIYQAEQQGASIEDLKKLLGRGRARKGIFEGDLDEGELEIGQVAASFRQVEPAAEIVNKIWTEYQEIKNQLCRQ